MHKYEKIKRLGHKSTDGLFTDGCIVVQEKLDGANFRIYIPENEWLSYGSRNVDYRNIPDSDIPKSFRPTIEYVEKRLDRTTTRALFDIYGPITIFGESMHKHTLEYDWDSTPRVLIFDVYSHAHTEYLPQTEVEYCARRLGLECAPLLDCVPASEIDPSDYEEIESQYRDGVAEGVVFKNRAEGVSAKLITEQFAEMHESAKTSNNVKEVTDAMRMADTYVGRNNRRIEKLIDKLVHDEGHDLEMPLMEHLGRRVITDIADEEAVDFIYENWTVDFHEFRKSINNKCVNTLKARIRNRGLDTSQAQTA